MCEENETINCSHIGRTRQFDAEYFLMYHHLNNEGLTFLKDTFVCISYCEDNHLADTTWDHIDIRNKKLRLSVLNVHSFSDRIHKKSEFKASGFYNSYIKNGRYHCSILVV